MARGRRVWRPIGRAEVFGFLAALALIAAFIHLSRDGLAAVGGGTGTNATSTTSTSTEPGSTGLAPGNALLNQFLSGAVAAQVTKFFQGVTVTGSVGATTASVTISAFTDFGPKTGLPVGDNSATCTGAPTGTNWPAPNCTANPGATLFDVAAGTTNVHVNVHTAFGTPIAQNSSAFGLLLGDFHSSFQTALLDQNWSFLDALFGRLRGFGTNGAGPAAMLPGSQLAAAASDDAGRDVMLAQRGPDGRMQPTPWIVWFRPHGTLGKVDDSSERLGFRYDIAGITTGAEHRWPGPWLAGATLGYAHASVTQRISGDKGSIDSLQLGAYGGYRDPRTHVIAAALFAQNWIGTERLTALAPATAKARYTGQAYTIGVEAGRLYPVMGISVQPFASLVYTHLRQGGFTEQGSTLLEIAGRSQSANALKLSIGARVWRDIDLGWGLITPEFRARWVQDLLNERRAITGRFVGDPAQTSFTVAGAKPTPAAAIIGASITAHFDNNLKVALGYDAEIRSNARAHTFQAMLKMRW